MTKSQNTTEFRIFERSVWLLVRVIAAFLAATIIMILSMFVWSKLLGEPISALLFGLATSGTTFVAVIWKGSTIAVFLDKATRKIAEPLRSSLIYALAGAIVGGGG